ncbi:hypothetical protein FOCC_FOCC016092 [Frankliniella occidentalis]|nr:hypothetical protein FOCC_FOCC016092 [Frankliniella occidentalis]
MDKTSFVPATEDPACQDFLRERRDSILQYALQTLEKPHVRADYRQLLELVVIFMGENPHKPKTIRFSPPIAVSSARFMARIIYCLMIHMFALSGEFPIQGHVLANIRQLNLFFVSTYMTPWYTATKPASGPRIDLQLLKDIVNYTECAQVKRLASEAFTKHLWYLHSVTVGLAFFDEEISVEEKREMVERLKVPTPKNLSPWKRYVLPPKKPLSFLKDKSLSFFVSNNTLKYFKIMKIDEAFLHEDPALWHEHESYKDGLRKVQALHVVNDVAERGVALVKRFSKQPLTRDEDRFQDLLLVQNELLKNEKYSTATLRLAHYSTKK